MTPASCATSPTVSRSSTLGSSPSPVVVPSTLEPDATSGSSSFPDLLGTVHGMARTRLYRNGVLEAEDFPLADVSDHLEDPSTVVWVDVCEPDREDLAAIAEELQLHTLAVEDAVAERQRPKLDRYRSHLFVTGYAVRLDAARAGSSAAEVEAFITRQALVTVRKSDGLRHRRRGRRAGTTPPTSPKHGVEFLLHGLLDVIVDSAFRRRPVARRRDRGPGGHALRRAAAQPGGAAALVRAAQEPGRCCGGSSCRCARSSTR